VDSRRDFVPAQRFAEPLPETALVFAFREARLMIVERGEGAPAIPTLGQLDAAGIAGATHFLGALAGTPCLAMSLARDVEAPPGCAYVGLRSLFTRIDEAMLAIAGLAFQVVEWDRTHRYCGVCGTPTEEKPDERAKRCPACGYVAYPRVSPAMMVLVTRDRELLLARARRFPTAMYSALAGFVEPGESIEDCIRREVREEVGVEVARLAYFSSQSWAFPHSLMIAFTAEYAGGEINPDREEIVDARWFALDALPELPSRVSIARRLIEATAARLAGRPGPESPAC